jgi:3-oxoacyl-[acyl-carrier protein] reductase
MTRRTALITGCGKPDGMGQAIARTLAAAGVAVVVCDREPAGVPNRRQERVGTGAPAGWRGVATLVEEIVASGGEASYLLGDVGSEADARRMVEQAVSGHGRLDIVVNNAAAPQGLDRRDIEEIPVEVWDEVVRVNLRGTYLISRFAVPLMRRRRWGRVVNIASMAGLVGSPHSTAYSASKAAVLGLTRSLAVDVAPWGITVNAICPGLVGTSRAILDDDPALDVEAELGRRAHAIPVGRVGRPADVAAAVGYLASEGSGYLTGQALVLDGGGLQPFPLARPAEREPAGSAEPAGPAPTQREEGP